MSARAVDHVIRQPRSRKAPQPVCLAVDPPTSLVGVQDCRVQRVALDLLVPGIEHFLQPVPHLQQPAAGEPELEVETEHIDDLRQRVAQGVVQPSGEHQHAMPQGRAAQRVGHGRLDLLLTLRTPVAVDNMFGHHRLEVSRNVFDIALARLRAAVQRTAAIGTTVGLMFFAGVDTLGRWLWTACSHMPWLAARLLLSLARGAGLEMCRFHPGGSGVRIAVGGRIALSGQLGECDQREHYRLFALSEDFVPAAR